MTDRIVQEVRDIRAFIAAEFGYNRTKLIAWAREQPPGSVKPQATQAMIKRRRRPLHQQSLPWPENAVCDLPMCQLRRQPVRMFKLL